MMKILGVGVDVVEVARFERAIGRGGEDLLREFLRPSEIGRCYRSARPALAIASSFAAKEALFKALGTGRSGRISWHDLEVVEEGRRIGYGVSGETARLAALAGVRRAHLSLGWTDRVAVAWSVLEGVLP